MMEALKKDYDIIRKIGSGGMAEILLARHKESGKEVAIKLLHPDKKNSIVAKKRFKSEIELTKKIKSEYVIKIYEAVWTPEVQYIVMEYVDGHILKNYIAKRSRLTVDESIEFMKQLALGFGEIHNNGIIHRDIKATNVMVSDYGSIKIIDFGIALNDESARLTKTDNIIGSVHYIAPEIIEQKPITLQSDIYALGVLMFEMLTGEVPFRENDALATALKHKKSTIPHVNKSFQNIPQSVANVVIKATAKDLSKRYKSMYEFYKDLTTVLSKERMYEPVLDLDAKPKKSFMSIINSKTMLIAISAVALILITIIVLLVVVL